MHGTKMLQDSDRSCPTASLAVTALASRLTGVIQERTPCWDCGFSPARKSAVLCDSLSATIRFISLNGLPLASSTPMRQFRIKIPRLVIKQCAVCNPPTLLVPSGTPHYYKNVERSNANEHSFFLVCVDVYEV